MLQLFSACANKKYGEMDKSEFSVNVNRQDHDRGGKGKRTCKHELITWIAPSSELPLHP